jgi:hypothetical protein
MGNQDGFIQLCGGPKAGSTTATDWIEEIKKVWARLDRRTLERLIHEKKIRPTLKEREAKQLVAQFLGETLKMRSARAILRERLRRLAEYFAANLTALSADDRELATKTLTRVIEQIGAAETAILDGNGNPPTCTTNLAS